MFDRSLLPPAQLEFVVISDTHYMLDPGDRPLEFESRRKQTPRSEVALKLAASLDPDFILHLGDLSQEYPEAERFQQAMAEARGQLERCGVSPRYVPGNHDIGDKADPTMPTHPVRPESLAYYHTEFGPSWYSFDRAGCHFIVLNSQILDADLPETGSQWRWLEEDLAAHRKDRTFLFLHLPPYLWNETEPGYGHYDNLNRPARTRLLTLVRRSRIECLVAGHVHFAFTDRIGPTRYHILQSPAFTRPGFSHLFTAPPPPEQGRDDTGKLGFYLFRVFPDRTDVHLIRTGGALTLPEAEPDTPLRVVTRTSASLPRSPIGLTLRHPLTPAGEVPLAYPSVVRQPVRNDYPFLSCLELGITSVRTPWTDLADRLQNRRLSMLRDEGIKVTAILPWPALPVDGWEIQLPGTPWPPPEGIPILKQCRQLSPSPLSLSPVIPGERQQGKQHPRTRIGYRLQELEELNDRLAAENLHIDRVLCRIDAGASPWKAALDLRNLPTLSRIDHIDFAVELPYLDDRQNANRAAEAAFAAALLPASNVYFDPLIDFDRTMDILKSDTLSRKRSVFRQIF